MTSRSGAQWVWLAGFAGATALGVLVATQNYLALSQAGQVVPWWAIALAEACIWYVWLAMSPAIVHLTRRVPLTGRRLLASGAVHVAAALAMTLVGVVIANGVRLLLPIPRPPGMGYVQLVHRAFSASFASFLIVYGAIVALILAWDYYQGMRTRQVRESQLEAELVRAQLDALRMQIHPHFLFNTLHGISALMQKDVPAARKMIRRLSELLRVALEDGGHEVRLEDELTFLSGYAEIQLMRFGDRLQVTYDVSPEARAVRVPRLLLQPLVENSIKHGVSHHPGRGTVQVEGRVEGGVLTLRVRDNGPGFPAREAARTRPGTGLANTRARLETLYGDRYRLRYGNGPAGGAVVEITLPAGARPPAARSGAE